ncbi:MAG: class I tRNA ligase family protein, partial [Planctomycetota bacterium]|nr:class I tRNA ligase family protein [Planctomycetota bacterium]
MSSQELPKHFNPGEAEPRWFSFWERNGYFAARPGSAEQHYSIVIPPPNVTGALHLGHALNNTIQDILVRWRRMQGFDTLWMPGTDHAGIATQAVVEKRLFEEENKTRHDIGREALVKRIWDWKDEYEDRIIGQLRKIGSSCDWSRTRFTLDDVCAKAVRHTFFGLFKKGLIYRGKRLVNWDTYLQTAVADDEIFHETVQGNLWHFKYPLADGSGEMVIATTRPETMLGDTAVAVHPEDERYKDFIGKTVMLPIVNREIPVIEDEVLVDPKFGTGCVKVTPAHDPNDYDTGLRHDLEMINILTPDGMINENGGAFAGQDRYEAREGVVAELERLGLMEKIEEHENQVGHSDRSKTPIEPYLSDQWFVKMEDLAESAMEAVRDGRVKFTPERYSKSYLDWLGEKRDW